LVGPGGPAAGFVDLETQEEGRYFNSYDYEPTVSDNGEFVALISEGAGGILIKQLK